MSSFHLNNSFRLPENEHSCGMDGNNLQTTIPLCHMTKYSVFLGFLHLLHHFESGEGLGAEVSMSVITELHRYR